MMDTLSAFMEGVDRIGLDRKRLALLERLRLESFGHPSHKVMLLAHEARTDEHYGRNLRGDEPATDEQMADLLNEANLYKSPIPYKPRKRMKNTPTVIPADRLLQIAVEAAGRKKAS